MQISCLPSKIKTDSATAMAYLSPQMLPETHFDVWEQTSEAFVQSGVARSCSCSLLVRSPTNHYHDTD